MENPSPQRQPSAPPSRPLPTATMVIFLCVAALAVVTFFTMQGPKREEIPYNDFWTQLQAGNIAEVEIDNQRVVGKFKKAMKDEETEFFATVLTPFASEDLDKELRKQGVVIRSIAPQDSTFLLMFVYLFVTVLLFVVIWIMFRRARDQFMGGGGLLSGFTKSKPQKYEGDKQAITFKDVAGLEGVKQDLQE